MNNSDVSSIISKRPISGVRNPFRRNMNESVDRSIIEYTARVSEINLDHTRMTRRQQQVLQAPAATCSVDSSSHESVTDSKSDLGTYCAYESNISANCALNISANRALVSEFTLSDSQINNSQLGDKPVAASTTKPRRFEICKINIKMVRKTREKRRRRKQ